MLKFQKLVSSSTLLSPSLSSSDSLMSSNLFFGFGASTLSLATPSSPFSKSSAALILRKHPSLLLSLRSFHWGSSAVARWRKSPSTLLLPLSTKSSRTASLRCVWCQHDSDLDSEYWARTKPCRGSSLFKILDQTLIIKLASTSTNSYPQLFNQSFQLMSRRYVSEFNEKYALNQWEAFSYGCIVVISFHFLLQSSEFYWPFGLVFW